MGKELNSANEKMQGLTEEEVLNNRSLYGTNVLTPPKRQSLIKLYLDKFRDPIIKILLVAAFFSLILAFFENEYAETIGIFIAIFLATTIGFYFECDASRKFDVLNNLDEESLVKVKRNGRICQVARKDIVINDIVLLEVGDEVPADGILLKATDLQINESSLTGEMQVNKYVEEAKQDNEATYKSNTVLRSSMVMNGRGVIRITAVGDATEIGKVAKKSTEVTSTDTPLHQQLTKLAKLISKIGSVVAVATFLIFLIHDLAVNLDSYSGNYIKIAQVVLNYFMMSVTLIVMAVPEGLPMAITLSLALNMRRMLKSNNLVRKLHSCETMGAVTVICTDKTGTLTQNKMQVAEIIKNDDGEEIFDYSLALNTTAYLDDKSMGGIGNPTEVALLLWLNDNGKDYKALREGAKIVHQLPFSTERKYMATIADVNGKRWIFMKGAPEIVASFCNFTEGEEREKIKDSLLNFQKQAMRTLAFACKEVDADDCLEALKEKGLQWQGLAAISDPLREDVAEAVNLCRSAGVKVKIVTGDVSATAVEIARQIGIWDESCDDECQITGADFAALSDEEALERAGKIKVMSRARPTDKQRLVELLQKRGEVVAVTGDGTNDAPALNYAHVGLSLGSGTSVAKEASDMTLLDDSFMSIEKAVMWGRSLYKNIQRFIFFQLIVNVTALLLVLVGSFVGTELPLTVTQILWVNLIMDTFAAMALSTLPPSREVMKEKPRSPKDFIITRDMGKGILFIGLSFFVIMFIMLYHCERVAGVSPKELTIFFTTFVFLQFWNLFNAKTFGSNHSAFRHFWRDNGLILVILIVFAGQWLIVEFGGKMFRTVPLSLNEWLYIISLTSLVLWVGEIWRLIKRKKNA